MALKTISPTSPGRRHRTITVRTHLSKRPPNKRLVGFTVKKTGGRNSTGKVTVRHIGGGHKQKFRLIDFKRNKLNVPGKVVSLEYDPNRSANIALVNYVDGDKRYILSPELLKVGDNIISGDKVEILPGNATHLANIPVGTPIHNLELTPGKGGQIVRSAGSSAFIQAKEGDFVSVLLPSKEIRLIRALCLATIGQVSNPDHQNVSLGKAGRSRHLGIRPTVRGTAQHPDSHPHGGGEGRSGVGLKYPKTPWGKHAFGVRTRNKKKHSQKYLVRDRRSKQ